MALSFPVCRFFHLKSHCIAEKCCLLKDFTLEKMMEKKPAAGSEGVVGAAAPTHIPLP